MECTVAVFDVDGVLLSNQDSARPVGVKSLLFLLDAGYRVYIHSGRSRREAGSLRRALREAGIPLSRVAGLLLRDRPVPEVDWKLYSAGLVVDREGCIGEAHDDNPYVLAALRRTVITGVLHEGSSCLVLYGSSIVPWCRPSRAL